MTKVDELIKYIKNADAIIVGAGSGMSNAAGMDFWYSASPIFMKHMKYFYDKYRFEGIFNGFYNHFDSEEEHWAFMLEALNMIFNIPAQKPTYKYLKTLIGNKPVHYVTTNQDTLFKKYFSENEVSEIQGSWDYFQSPDTNSDKKLYSSEKLVKELLSKVENHRLASDLIPTSDINDLPLIPWARGSQFLEDKKYFEEHQKWNHFMGEHLGEKILFLELGVGRMTPMFIQEPFWEMTQYMKKSFYININPKDALTNPVIQDRSLLIDDDINEILKVAAEKIQGEKMTNHATKIAKQWIEDADAVLVTASNGLSISEGLNLFANDEKLKEVLGDLVDTYHLPNLITAFNFDYWRVAARVIEYYGNDYETSDYMLDLKKIINNKPYFVWTSNVDHHFSLAGFDNLFEIEGNWLEAVCSQHPEDHGIYKLSSKMHDFYQKDKSGLLTEEDIPTCEQCGAPLALNTASDVFQINHQQISDFEDFVQKYEDQKLLVLELGVGARNQMIKAPSMQLVASASNSHYITINKDEVAIPNMIADRSIGYSSSIDEAFKELLTGKSFGTITQGPSEPKKKTELTPEQKLEQEKAMQQFYPHYMIDIGIRPGSSPMYLTIDKDHPSYLHSVRYGQSWMYSIGDAAIAHCFTQNGQYYQVRLGLDKSKDEVHGFYADSGTFVAFESVEDSGAGFSQISTELMRDSDDEILIPIKDKIIQLFPNQKDIIERFSVD